MNIVPNEMASRTEWEAAWAMEGIQVAELAWIALPFIAVFAVVSIVVAKSRRKG